MAPIPDILQLILAGVTIGAAISDLHSRTIPNWLAVCGLALGFGINSYLFQWSGLGHAAMGFGLAAAVYLPLFALRAMGGGDLKLMAAVGSIAGARQWFAIFLLTAVLGGLAAIVLLLFKGILRSTLRNVAYIVNELIQLRAPHLSAPELNVSHPQAVTLPHGAAIAGGTLLYLALLRFGLM